MKSHIPQQLSIISNYLKTIESRVYNLAVYILEWEKVHEMKRQNYFQNSKFEYEIM